MHSDLFMAVVVAALALSELLTFIPSIKSNGILQLCIAGLKKLAGK